MKKLLLSLSVLLCLCLALPMSACASTEITDAEQNITFTIPDGWTREESLEVNNFKYVYMKDDSEVPTLFTYSVTDAYASLSDSFKSKYPRSKFDNSIFTIEEYKDYVNKIFTEENGCRVKNVDKAVIAGNHYFKIVAEVDTDSGATENLLIYSHLYNGYNIFFRLETLAETLNEEDLTPLMETVKFGNETKSNKTETEAGKTAKEIGTKVGSRLLGRVILIVLVALFSGGAGIFGSKKKKAKRAAEAAAQQNNTYAPAQPANTAPVQSNTYAPTAPPQNDYYQPPVQQPPANDQFYQPTAPGSDSFNNND